METCPKRAASAPHGPYDRLYRARGRLWPDRPGRMVERAVAQRAPGRALDLGCGDGKDVYFLEKCGWTVDGVEVSSVAIEAASRRLLELPQPFRGSLLCRDVLDAELEPDGYDLVICYGLYHCLTDDQLFRVQTKVERALRSGGLFAFAIFNDDLPLLVDHGTDSLILRPREFMVKILSSWRCVALQYGEIAEDHLPLVPQHRHALTWGLFEKSCVAPGREVSD